MLKLVVGQNPNDATEYGYVAGDDDNFGSCIPDTLEGKLIKRITQKGGAIEAHVGSKAFGAVFNLTTGAGIKVPLTWDAATSSYKGTGAPKTFKSHYDFNGILELQPAKGTPPPAPQKPTGFAKPTSSAITATGAMVTWVAPTGGDAVTGYSVAVDKAGTAITGSPFAMAAGTLKKALTGLTASTAYNVVVTATNGAGSLAAAPLTVTTIA